MFQHLKLSYFGVCEFRGGLLTKGPSPGGAAGSGKVCHKNTVRPLPVPQFTSSAERCCTQHSHRSGLRGFLEDRTCSDGRHASTHQPPQSPRLPRERNPASPAPPVRATWGGVGGSGGLFNCTRGNFASAKVYDSK